MAQNIERTYNIPLRQEYMKVANYRRTEKAARALRAFIVKHMKSEDVKIGKFLNEFVWMHGMKNPPHHVKVNLVKIPEGTVYVELFGKPLKIGKEEKKEKEKTAKEDKKETAEKKVAEKKESKTIDAEVVAEKPKAAPKKEKKKE
ncbi:60S ribosomal protein L31 [Candidatus Woesearchaeota archaeon]|nr:60S ribosomal protein L31 [Candidatus Woesearchaeota archaeon]